MIYVLLISTIFQMLIFGQSVNVSYLPSSQNLPSTENFNFLTLSSTPNPVFNVAPNVTSYGVPITSPTYTEIQPVGVLRNTNGNEYVFEYNPGESFVPQSTQPSTARPSNRPTVRGFYSYIGPDGYNYSVDYIPTPNVPENIPIIYNVTKWNPKARTTTTKRPLPVDVISDVEQYGTPNYPPYQTTGNNGGYIYEVNTQYGGPKFQEKVQPKPFSVNAGQYGTPNFTPSQTIGSDGGYIYEVNTQYGGPKFQEKPQTKQIPNRNYGTPNIQQKTTTGSKGGYVYEINKEYKGPDTQYGSPKIQVGTQYDGYRY